MKILNLIRHAEAETGLSSKEDFFRSLTDSGIDDIKSLDNYLVHDNFSRHKIICSTSVRTRETLENLKKSLNPDSSVIYSPDLYLGTFKKLLNTVNLESQNTRMITLIGHNPGLSDLISYLVGDYEINDMGTSSFISLSFDKTIKSSSYEGSAKIERFIQSKNNSIINL
jgi:phosphohistidine phosphatase